MVHDIAATLPRTKSIPKAGRMGRDRVSEELLNANEFEELVVGGEADGGIECGCGAFVAEKFFGGFGIDGTREEKALAEAAAER